MNIAFWYDTLALGGVIGLVVGFFSGLAFASFAISSWERN